MTETIEWVAPDGDETTLDVEWGAAGRFAPPAELYTVPRPLGGGSIFRNVRHAERRMILPLYLDAEDAITLRQDTRALVRAFDPVAGEGFIRNTAPDGSVRLLYGRAVSGLELGEQWGKEAGEQHQRAAVTFVAPDPYWYEAEPVQTDYRLPESTVPIFPFLPLILTISNLFEEQTITNSGDVEAWPIWTITGPATSVTLTNVRTGLSLSIPAGLEASEVFTIDTRPGLVDVSDGAGNNRMGATDDSSWFWPLLPDDNLVNINVVGATTATVVRLTYRRRYLTV